MITSSFLQIINVSNWRMLKQKNFLQNETVPLIAGGTLLTVYIISPPDTKINPFLKNRQVKKINGLAFSRCVQGATAHSPRLAPLRIYQMMGTPEPGWLGNKIKGHPKIDRF